MSSCGTYSRYTAGCRCEPCRHAAVTYRQQPHVKKRAADWQRARKCNPEARASRTAQRYNLTLDQYKVLITRGCGIENCDRGGRRVIDHDRSCCPGDYSCGSCVRGCLCDYHNKLAGLLLREGPAIAAYLANPPGVPDA